MGDLATHGLFLFHAFNGNGGRVDGLFGIERRGFRVFPEIWLACLKLVYVMVT